MVPGDIFRLDVADADVRQEIRAGAATFMTMAYIIVVNPHILAAAGMPTDAVMMATCLAAALGCFLMGLLTNYPFALAPGMGLNAFFAYTVVVGMGLSWQGALAAVFISGACFFVLTLLRVREAIVNAIPASLKASISVGIGFFIALIGLKNAGIIVFNPGTGSLGMVRAELLPAGASLHSVYLALFGLALTGTLVVRKVTGALLWGILGTFLAAVPLGLVQGDELAFVALPSGLSKTFMALDFGVLFDYGLLTVIFTFFFVDLFDTAGTLVGLSSKTGMLDQQGHLPRAKQALMADSVATMAGATLGTSSTTTYIESAAGVAEGGRTGLTAITTGLLFLLALFFFPLVQQIPPAATAPVLVIVGIFMMEPVTRIDFSNFLEAIPAFFTIAMMPLAFSIADGIVAGILSYTFLRAASGRWREVGLALWLLSALFILRFFLL